jgi:hypothetical protein
MGHTVGERWWKNVVFCVFSVAVMESVLRRLRLGEYYFRWVVRRHRVPVFEGHRLPSTGSRCDIRWVSGGGKTLFFVYLAWRLRKSVLTLAVRGNTISGRVVRRQRVPVFKEHRYAVDRKSMGHTVGERWWKNVVFCVFSVVVMEKCFDAAVRGNTISGRVVRRHRVPVFDASISVDRKSMGHTVGERLWKHVVFCVFSVAVMEKCFDAYG